jgi:hypothetical protein
VERSSPSCKFVFTPWVLNHESFSDKIQEQSFSGLDLFQSHGTLGTMTLLGDLFADFLITLAHVGGI